VFPHCQSTTDRQRSRNKKQNRKPTAAVQAQQQQQRDARPHPRAHRPISQNTTQVAARPAGARRAVVVRAAATTTLTRKEVPLKLEEGEMPLNTYSNKAPFKGVIKSVERIVGANATGETCNIVIKTEGKIPFWEGQSYGVIPPVRHAAGVGAGGGGG